MSAAALPSAFPLCVECPAEDGCAGMSLGSRRGGRQRSPREMAGSIAAGSGQLGRGQASCRPPGDRARRRTTSDTSHRRRPSGPRSRHGTRPGTSDDTQRERPQRGRESLRAHPDPERTGNRNTPMEEGDTFTPLSRCPRPFRISHGPQGSISILYSDACRSACEMPWKSVGRNGSGRCLQLFPSCRQLEAPVN